MPLLQGIIQVGARCCGSGQRKLASPVLDNVRTYTHDVRRRGKFADFAAVTVRMLVDAQVDGSHSMHNVDAKNILAETTNDVEHHRAYAAGVCYTFVFSVSR